MEMTILSALTLTTLLISNPAQAQEPWKRGVKVGSVTALSSMGGFVLGWTLGSYSNLFDGLDPVIGSFLGATISPPLTSVFMSKYVDANPLIVGGTTSAMSIAGITCVISGLAAEQLDVAVVGGGLLFLGTGLTAGISAGLFPNKEIAASLNPIITPQYRGITFQTEF